MNDLLTRWIGRADATRHLSYFGIGQIPIELAEISNRFDDYYISLVGELFDKLKVPYENSNDWAKLANALAQMGNDEQATRDQFGISRTDALLFASTAFYFGGFSASAYVTSRQLVLLDSEERYAPCLDLITRPTHPVSDVVRDLRRALIENNLEVISAVKLKVQEEAAKALSSGPDEYIPQRLLESLVDRFQVNNIRAVLPEASNGFWDSLVESLLTRANPTWDFFPSQIQAIQRGLLFSPESYSLQMPTGAGKTTLCEALLYAHLTANPESAALFLVPYRSLASELRSTLIRRLNKMGLPSRCAYGGTVPSGDEVHGLEQVRAIVATPEAIGGLLSAAPDFAKRITLVVCDEGHLLDGGQRGIGLELLLARIKARVSGAPKFVFISAIVPNIEEVNSWLGGRDESVVRSEFRPAVAEFGLLTTRGSGANSEINLRMHPHDTVAAQYEVSRFLDQNDFAYTNTSTGRQKTYAFRSIKVRAVAAARKVMPMGAVAVFSANKRGHQGVIGLAEELVKQLGFPLPLPNPQTFMDGEVVSKISEYLYDEFGPDWIGTRAFQVGAVVHHGDIPQETREVLELAVREEYIRLIFCTTTLAEGVNFPIRTLVLYSVQRLGAGGSRDNLLARDIKNLVGRAGRAGATTKGLVLVANEDQWGLVEPVARQMPGEDLVGALRKFLEELRDKLAIETESLDGAGLESLVESGSAKSLVEGVDATLIELANDEISSDALIELAHKVALSTFAAQGTDEGAKRLLLDVFRLRAEKILAMRAAGRLSWLRETGASTRLVSSVEAVLLPSRTDWETISPDAFEGVLESLFDWAWTQSEVRRTAYEAFKNDTDENADQAKIKLLKLIKLWISGVSLLKVSTEFEEPLDDLLGVLSRAVAYSLQTVLEQGVALLGKFLAADGKELSKEVVLVVEKLRYGVPTKLGVTFAASGVRHRKALVRLSSEPSLIDEQEKFLGSPRLAAFELLSAAPARWQEQLGRLVYENTLKDLTPAP